MVKLVRLATNDEGVFTNSFGNNIILKPQSKIALLNLTFKIIADQYNIGPTPDGDNNQTLVFNGNVGVTNPTVVNMETLNAGTEDEFLLTVESSLNRLLTDITNFGAPTPELEGRSMVYSAWELFKNDSKGAETFGATVLTYRYAPLCTVTGGTFVDNTTPRGTKNQRLFNFNADNMEVLSVYPDTSVNLVAGRARDDLSGQPKYWCGAIEDYALCNGTGLYMARVADFTDNGTGNDDNGFAIGLTWLESSAGNKPNLEKNMNVKTRNFEIKFQREGSNYIYIQDSTDALEVESTVAAEQCSLATYPDVNDHDIMWFRIAADPGPPSEQSESTGNRGFLIAGIWNIVAGVATEHILFKQVLTDIELIKDKLFPYMYINGAKGEVKVDALSYTPDPFLESNEFWQRTSQVDYSLFYNLHFNSKTLRNVVPFINLDRFKIDSQFSLGIHNDILRQLGFITLADGPQTNGMIYLSRKIGSTVYEGTNGQVVFVADTSSSGELSDNFQVISDSVQLQSFDASQVAYNLNNPVAEQRLRLSGQEKAGRRKNILMTIPVNDNTSGVVEYDANTPIFIDLDNANTINVKNLNFRVITKYNKPIRIGGGTAIMTLLIQNGPE